MTFEFITKKKNWNKNGKFQLSNGHAPEATPAESTQKFFTTLKYFCTHRFFLAFADFVLISFAFLSGAWVRLGNPLRHVMENPAPYALLTVSYLATLYIFDLYNMKKISTLRQIPFRIALSVFLAVGCAAICFYLVPQFEYGRGILFLDAAFAWVLLVGWRFLYNRFLHLSKARVPTLVLGSAEAGRSALRVLKGPHSRFEVVGILEEDPEKVGSEVDGVPIIGRWAGSAEIIQQCDVRAVVLAIDGNGYSRVARKVLETRLRGVEVIDLPTLYEKFAFRLPLRHVEEQWLVSANGFDLLSRGARAEMQAVA